MFRKSTLVAILVFAIFGAYWSYATPGRSTADSRLGMDVTPIHGGNRRGMMLPTFDEMIVEARILSDAARAIGGLEATSAGFHEYTSPGSIYEYPVLYWDRDYSVPSFAPVDVRREPVLLKGIDATSVIESGSPAGGFDVMAHITPSAAAYCAQKQLARDGAWEAGEAPSDFGVALVHRGAIYSDFTYGELADMAAANNGWVTLITGTSQEEAAAIATALHP